MLHRYVVQVVAPIPSSDCHVRGGASHTCSESRSDARRRLQRQQQRNGEEREGRKSGKWKDGERKI